MTTSDSGQMTGEGGGLVSAPSGGGGWGQRIYERLGETGRSLSQIIATLRSGKTAATGTQAVAGTSAAGIPFVNTEPLSRANVTTVRLYAKATGEWRARIATVQTTLLKTLAIHKELCVHAVKLAALWDMIGNKARAVTYWRNYKGASSDLAPFTETSTTAPPRKPAVPGATPAVGDGGPLAGSPKGGWGSSLLRQAQYWASCACYMEPTTKRWLAVRPT